MAEEKSDVKPQVETIQISLQTSNGEQTHFKVKPTTKMGKILDAYAKRQGVPVTTFRVLVDGDRVNETDTPESVRASRAAAAAKAPRPSGRNSHACRSPRPGLPPRAARP